MSTPQGTRKPEIAMPRLSDDSSTNLSSPSTSNSDTKYWILLSCAIFLVTVAFAVLGLAYYKIFGSQGNKVASSAPSQPGGGGAPGAGVKVLPLEEKLFAINKVKRNDIEKSKGEEYTSIGQALADAPPGVTLRIRDQEVYEEQLIHGRHTQHTRANLRIVAEKSADGKTATLRFPREAAPGTPLVHLDRADGFEIRGLILDGDNRCEDLVVLSGDCQGAKLEDLDLKGFQHSAIRLENCNSIVEGQERRAILLRDIRINLPNKGDNTNLNAISFAGVNSEVHVQRCRFSGPCSTFVQVEGTLKSSLFEDNLFVGGKKTAMQFGKEPGDAFTLDVRLRNNSFVGFQTAMLFRQQPAAGAALTFNGNLFYQISQGVGATEAPAAADRVAEVLQGDGNVRDAKSPAGQWQDLAKLKIVELPFELPTGADAANKQFRFSVKSPLATAGHDGCFVGALRPWLE